MHFLLTRINAIAVTVLALILFLALFQIASLRQVAVDLAVADYRQDFERQVEEQRRNLRLIAGYADFFVSNPVVINLVNEIGRRRAPSQAARLMVSRLLAQVAAQDRVSVAYLIDREGRCLDASRADFVGKNYGFRPYVLQALREGESVYAAKDVTSKEIGIYYAREITLGQADIGVMVIKLGLDFFIRSPIHDGETGMILGLATGEGLLLNQGGVRILGALSAALLEKVGGEDQFPLDEIVELPLSQGSWEKMRTRGESVVTFKGGERIRAFVAPLHGSELAMVHLVPEAWFYNALLSKQGIVYSIAAALVVVIAFLLLFLTIVLQLHRKKLALEGELRQESEQRHDWTEKFGYVLEHSGEGFWMTDLESMRIVEVNRGICAMLGHEREELIGLRVLELFPEKAGEQVEHCFSPEFREAEQSRVETEMLRANGGTVPVILASIIREIGATRCCFTFASDISLQKSQQQQLRLFRNATEQNGSGIVITDTKGSIQYVNRRFTALTGYHPSEVIGKNPRVLKSGEQDASVYKSLWETITQGGTWRGKLHNRRKNGSMYWEEITIAPICDDSDSITHYIAVKDDISDRVALEQELRRFHLAAEQAAEGFLLADFAGHVTYLNPAWAAMHGYAGQDLLGAHIYVFHSREQVEGELQGFCEQVHLNGSFSAEIGHLRRDGSQFPCLMTTTLLHDEKGRENGMLVIAKDISEIVENRREIEAAREQAQSASRSKSEFLANMSHEIRTPMNAIMGMTDLLLDTPLNDEQQRQLNIVRNSSEALLSLINDILDYSKAEAGKLELEIRPFNVQELVAGVADILRHAAREKGIELKTSISGDGYFILNGDSLRLRQVLLNLTGNAVKFTREGEVEISVDLRTADKVNVTALFNVRDTGIGIPAEKQKLLFESFSQADASVTREFGGTGLGLVISQQIVKLMGGTIRLVSSPGKGSIFSFILTMTQGKLEAETVVPAAVGASPTVGLELLLVEDNSANQQLATMMLKKDGHRVTVANNGIEALHFLRETDFDVVFMDIQMPRMDGLTATRVLRAAEAGETAPELDGVDGSDGLVERLRGGHVYVIAMTANAMRGDRERCLAAGMDDYMTKPYNREILAGALRVHAERGAAWPSDSGTKTKAAPPPKPEEKTALRDRVADHLGKAYGLDAEQVEMVLVTYRQTFKESMDGLDGAIAAGDLDEIGRMAHAVKGGLLNVGINELAELVKEMEFTARSGKSMDYAASASRLRQEMSPLLIG